MARSRWSRGQLVFTPVANYHGPASFTYTITDGTVSAVATVVGTVTPVNDAPVASNDSFTVAEDDSVTVDVLGNDIDVDGNPLTITHVNGTAITAGGPAVSVTNGSVSLGLGQLVFTPAANYHGPASFTYTITDGTVSAVATVSGTVTPVNDAPVARTTASRWQRMDSVTVNVLGNDSDVDGNPLTITHVNGQSITAGGPAVSVTNGSVQLVSWPARVHAGGELPRSGLVHLYDHGRHGLGGGDGQRHGHAGQRRAGRSERQLHGGRG